ncbi:carbamoyl phosphate synthase large subunit [Sulfodiicoccus acidiphilus]|uniref:Carbamoyl phosphate synthase large chain, N-terminal section n=1 Tax=Sulfodiicoccus acidiphilus TaxID=1670455 RepID=A0A348B0P8_9CREN|nr:carbamoyl phosphate synthase large subunit [Sulfodiicoccus acidiphilus]
MLGTQIQGIEKALSREKFRETMIDHGLPVPPSFSARNEDEAVGRARELGFPVMVRVSFNLGGRGSTVAWNEESFRKEIRRALAQSYIGELLVEKYLHHWKELEYEVMRDEAGNGVVVACMENLDPMGVHTGESVVVAPCQTLDNVELQDMRTEAVKVAESIGLVGECNVQFALSPNSSEHFVIETNPRMSRSSALASKATGYPLAYVAAKLALGYRLHEVLNKVTGVTYASFEPSLDYVVIKAPRWDMSKFEGIEESLGTEMKSIGEVMSIGRSFEEAIQKAVRMLDIGEPGVVGGSFYEEGDIKEALTALTKRKPYWFVYAAKALKEGVSEEQLYELTGIDRFFLKKINEIVKFYESLRVTTPSPQLIRRAKEMGFSDLQLSRVWGIDEDIVRKLRFENNILPVVKQIDTLAGEWPASTNYLYTTYNGREDDVEFKESEDSTLVIGAGGFRIGVSVEFDWGVVSLVQALREASSGVSVLNCNPETVSTDWDVVGKLYFDEVSKERILDLLYKEKFDRVALFAGGQLGNTVAKELEEQGVKIFGTHGRSVDVAEDRSKFSQLLEEIGVSQPRWTKATSMEEIREFVEEVGFPVLVRPSYVLSGSGMRVANNERELESYVRHATIVSLRYPVTISKFVDDAVEVEVDGVSDGNGVLGVILEHVEEAGVHSGDATIVVPTRKLTSESLSKVRGVTHRIAVGLGVKGPFNLQLLVKEGEPYVIEMNLRASRSMPFSSKAVGLDLIKKSVSIISSSSKMDGFTELRPKSWFVKTAQFSWAQLRGAYPYLGPEMRSTGEAAAFGVSFQDALIKSWLSTPPNRLPTGKLVLVYGRRNSGFLREAALTLMQEGIPVATLDLIPLDGLELIERERAIQMIREGKVEMLMTDGYEIKMDYDVRRTAADFNVPLVLNGRLALELSKAFREELTFYETRAYGGGI